MDEFLALSSLLTGLPGLQRLDPLSVEGRMAKDYLRVMKEQFGPGFDALLSIYRAVAAKPDPLQALLQDPGFVTEPVETAIATAAKQIVNLWLLSQYGGAGKLPDQDAGFFEKGFVWPLIRAHAIGFSHRSSGYWSTKPEAESGGRERHV
jgi:hypothetical protein